MSNTRLKKLENSLALNVEKIEEIDVRFINPDGTVGSVLKVRHTKANEWVKIDSGGSDDDNQIS